MSRPIRLSRTLLLVGMMLVASNAYAESSYIEVSADGWFTKVTGDGSEAGVQVRVGFLASASEKPSVEIPGLDNSAECVVESISDGTPGKNRGTLQFEIRVNTQVLADTGSCLIWVREPNGETATIVAYGYIVD